MVDINNVAAGCGAKTVTRFDELERSVTVKFGEVLRVVRVDGHFNGVIVLSFGWFHGVCGDVRLGVDRSANYVDHVVTGIPPTVMLDPSLVEGACI